jgi:hypothetical protein
MAATMASAGASGGYISGSTTTSDTVVLAKARADCFIPEQHQPFSGILVDPQALVTSDQTDLLVHMDYQSSKPGKSSTLWYSKYRQFDKRTAKRAEVVTDDYTFRSRNFWQRIFGGGKDKTIQLPVEDYVMIHLGKDLGTQSVYFFLEVEGGSATTYRILFLGLTLTHDQIAPSDCLQFIVKRCDIPLKKRTIGNMGAWMELYGTKGSATDPAAAEKLLSGQNNAPVSGSGQVFVSREQLETALAQINATDQALTDKSNNHEDRIAYIEGYIANASGSKSSGPASPTTVNIPVNFRGDFEALGVTIKDATGSTVYENSSVKRTGEVLQLPYGSYEVYFKSGVRSSQVHLTIDEKLMGDLPINFNL